MSKLDELIAATLAASQPPGCFASRLDGDAKKYVVALKAEEAKGNKVSRAAMRKVLSDAFDVKISEERIRSHLTGACSCAS